MKKYILNSLFLLIILSDFSGKVHSQVIVKDTLPPVFEWSLHLIDIPYMVDAAKTEAIRAGGGELPQTVTPKAENYGNFYRNLSMEQATEMARRHRYQTSREGV
jgi:hypothetical protein